MVQSQDQVINHASTAEPTYSSQREKNIDIVSPEGIRKYIERLNPRKSY